MNASVQITPPQSQVGLGIAYRLAAVLAFGFMATLVKLCADKGVHTFEIVFFRNAFAFIPIGIMVFLNGGMRVLRTTNLRGHATRSVVGVFGMLCGFTALGHLPLTEFTAINFSVPLLIAALSGLVLKEHVDRHRWGAVVVGFIGMLILVRPDPTHMTGVGMLFALGAVIGATGATLAIRQLSGSESGIAIAFYFTLAATLAGAAGLPFVWKTPDATTLLMLIGTGLCGGVGQLLLTQAFRLAPAAVVAPLDYASLLLNGVLGYIFWHYVPPVTTAIGGLIVAASGLYLVWRETGFKLKQAAAPVPPPVVLGAEDAASAPPGRVAEPQAARVERSRPDVP
ncbi:MAG: DMT family transporter [Hyphomonadaceae bacterium]